MAYVNKQNLSDFWTNAKRYIAARDADQCDWTSVPVNAPIYTFEAEPRTPVNPVIEFGFTETPPAEGEKGPDNPSTITGADSITVTKTGKNLIWTPWKDAETVTKNGITWTVNGDGTVTASGTATADSYFNIRDTVEGTRQQIKGGLPYVLSGCPSGGSNSTYLISFVCNSNTFKDFGSGVTFTVNTNDSGWIVCCVRSGVTVSNFVFKPQLELGSVATAFEPYSGVSVTVSLGETRYGGTLDVATGKMTVTGTKYEIIPGTADTSTFDASQHCYMFKPVNVAVPKGRAIGTEVCTHFIFGSEYSGSTVHFYCHSNGTIYFFNSAWSTESDATSFFNAQNTAGTPVTVYYPAANPVSTVDLTPQQLFSALSNSKVNTVFTDTGTISQLTYAKPAPSQEDVFRYANWHRTETAGAVAFAPVPESELHPVVNFSFTETPPMEGEKGPDNPSTINGVSSVMVTHDAGNIIEFDVMTVGTSLSSIAAGNPDGSFTINGTVPSGGGNLYRKNGTYAKNMELNLESYSTFLPAGTYKIGVLIESGTYTPNSGNCYIRYRTTKELGSGEYIDLDRSYSVSETLTSGGTITMPDGGGWYTYSIGCMATASFSNCTLRPYLYVDGADISGDVVQANTYSALPLGSSYYGGSIDLSTGLMTVTWERDVCTSFASVDAISTNTVAFRYNAYRYHQIAGGMLYDRLACNRFPVVDDSSDAEHCRFSGAGTSNTMRFYINKTRLDVSSAADPSNPTNAEWVAAANIWLASHPTFLVYILATPFIVQLTPQQIKALPALDRHEPRINTLYTDADSIQVSYQKSPIQTELELTDAILALGGGE